MEERIPFEVLDGLPPYGPMYISVGNTYNAFSEGLVVRFFKKDGGDWVGNFSRGHGSVSGVWALLRSSRVLVVSSGQGYFVEPQEEKATSEFGAALERLLETVSGRYILHDSTALYFVEPDGNIWTSGRIALDGIKDVSVEDNLVKGFVFDPSNDRWVPFLFDLQSQRLIEGQRWEF